MADCVVVTRAMEDGSSYREALAACGFAAVAMPVTRTEAPADPDALATALARTAYDAIVVASVRGAQALAAARDPQRPLPAVWAVGPATERALHAAGIAATFPTGVVDATSLAHALIEGGVIAGKRVLVPRAEEGRDEALVVLRAAGVIVSDVIAYRTVAAAADDPRIARGTAILLGGTAAACIAFAPSQVRALAELLARPFAEVQTRWIAIGETTAAALRTRGVIPRVAASPTPEGIANAVRAVCSPAS